MNMMVKGACALMWVGSVAQATSLETGFTRLANTALIASSARNPFANLLRTDMTPTREAKFQVGMWKLSYRNEGSNVVSSREDICGGEFPVNVYDMRQPNNGGDVQFRGGECNASFAKMGQGRVFVGGLEAVFSGDHYGTGHGDMKEFIAIAGFSSAANSYDIGYQAVAVNSTEGHQRFSVDLFDNSVGPVAGDESLLVEVRGYDTVLGR